MRYSQLARTAVQAVFGNGLRSALTMLGLVIGISSVIILVGIGDGTNRQVSEKMKALGGDALSAYLFDGDMGYNDLSGMNDLGAVDGVAPSKSLMKKLSVGTTVANKAFVEATDEHYLHVRNLKLQEGRNLSAVDRENRSKVIVLGSDVAKTLLGSADGAVGRTVKLDGDEFTVVGVLQNQGQSMGLNTGNVALVPFSTAVSMGESGTITSFYAKARGEDAIEAAKGEIGSYLTGTVHIPPGRFDIISQDEMLRAGNEIDGTMTLLLAGIAGISLVVAGIGVMNVMLVSVTERTREIGVMKVLGCELGSIRTMFLLESSTIGFIGGLIGVAFSLLASFVLNNLSTILAAFGQGGGLDLSGLMGGGYYYMEGGGSAAISIIPPWLMLAALVFATLVGLVAGILPANKAVRISALEAIRHD